jgi:hypothetical protein
MEKCEPIWMLQTTHGTLAMCVLVPCCLLQWLFGIKVLFDHSLNLTQNPTSEMRKKINFKQEEIQRQLQHLNSQAQVIACQINTMQQLHDQAAVISLQAEQQRVAVDIDALHRKLHTLKLNQVRQQRFREKKKGGSGSGSSSPSATPQSPQCEDESSQASSCSSSNSAPVSPVMPMAPFALPVFSQSAAPPPPSAAWIPPQMIGRPVSVPMEALKSPDVLQAVCHQDEREFLRFLQTSMRDSAVLQPERLLEERQAYLSDSTRFGAAISRVFTVLRLQHGKHLDEEQKVNFTYNFPMPIAQSY